MSLKSWAEAQRHKGGVVKYLYDVMVSDDSSGAAVAGRVTALETAVGKASGEGAGGIAKDVADAKAAIGTDDTTEGSLKKRCKAIETAIGDEDTAASILGRIKALETAANTNQGQE